MKYQIFALGLVFAVAGCAPLQTSITSANFGAFQATQPTLAAHHPVLAQLSLAPMLDRVAPAVVSITSTAQQPQSLHPVLNDPVVRRLLQFPPDLQAPIEESVESVGSGVIIDAGAGLIVTNAHVIEQASAIAVGLNEGHTRAAEIVAVDPKSDIALLKIDETDLTALPIADSDHLRVGDFVVAVGNPFGLGQTVTWGIVSALGRGSIGVPPYENYIQTDASINPGNSGGALVDLQGRLIGLNTAILAPAGGNVGISFAIPSNTVRGLVAQMRR